MPDRPRREHTSASVRSPLASRLSGVAAIGVTVAVGLGGAGCGSSHSSSAATKPALSKGQFIAQGNAICAHGNQALASAQKTLEKTIGNHAPTPAQVTAYVNGVFAPLIQSQIDQIRALGAPSGEQAAWAHMLDLAQTELNTVKSNPAATAGGNTHPFANFALLAHRYGLTACAVSG
jgi:hypothetical protein